MRRTAVAAACGLVVLVLCACADRRLAPPRASRRIAVLPLVPKIPGSAVLDTTGGEDVERMQMSVPVSADSVANFYRARLAGDGWSILSDRGGAAVVDIYAVRSGPQLWVHIERGEGSTTRYSLIAAVTLHGDTTATQDTTAR